MINLGLSRMAALVRPGPVPWKAIHVAGTNGKGSICAYLSAMLHAVGHPVGRFTSPHLVDRWDCITVNEAPVAPSVFRAAEDSVVLRNREAQIGATEFELLAAAAFEVFRLEQVAFGVVEVGLGGLLDATNVLDKKQATVLSKIGLDHQAFLGSTLREIAVHKAGIMRRDVPCIVDGSNPPEVLDALRQQAEHVGAKLVIPSFPPSLVQELSEQGFEPHQIQNLVCAYSAFRHSTPPVPGADETLSNLLPAIKQISYPGRLQRLDVSKIAGRPQEALLDGAHNVQSAEVLSAYIQKHIRRGKQPVTWVLAASAGKDIGGILLQLLQPQDRATAIQFGAVDGMPWIKAEDPAKILEAAAQAGVDSKMCRLGGADDLDGALQWAAASAAGTPVVIAGSLYLVGDVLRRLRAS